MEDTTLYLIIGVVTAVFTVLWRYIMDFRRDRRISDLENACYVLEQKFASSKGVSARNEKQARQTQAMTEAMAMIQSGKAPADVLKELAPKYPDVAQDLLKQYMG